MNRAGVIFILLSIYIFAAFGWWTYAHYLSTKTIHDNQKELLETSCYKATFDINGAVDQELFYDTLGLRTFFSKNYPALEVIIIDPHDPLNNFMVRPRFESYKEIDDTYHRKVKMYILEGVVMILLLFWGMVVIYRSLRKELHFKKQQTNFLLSITHELKTPLTAIRLYMETLLKRKLDENQVRSILTNTLDETGRLQDQVENLLMSAQLDSNKYELQYQTVNFSELCAEVIENFARPRNLENKIHREIQDQVILQADPAALEMVLTNLLSNAVKYAGENVYISVGLTQDDHSTKLTIGDNGPGVPDNEKVSLFDKFYRSGDENTRKTKGTGLGLFIVKHLIELHKGTIKIKDNQPKGCLFEINLNTNAE